MYKRQVWSRVRWVALKLATLITRRERILSEFSGSKQGHRRFRMLGAVISTVDWVFGCWGLIFARCDVPKTLTLPNQDDVIDFRSIPLVGMKPSPRTKKLPLPTARIEIMPRPAAPGNRAFILSVSR